MFFDIQSSYITIKKLFSFFDIKISSNPTSEEYKILEEKLDEIIKNNFMEKMLFSSPKNNFQKSNVQIMDINLGDFIEIEYIPPSIKYLNDYPKLSGIVIYIDANNNDGLIYSNKRGLEIISSFSRSYCGYGYGYDLSHIFLYHITRYEKI